METIPECYVFTSYFWSVLQTTRIRSTRVLRTGTSTEVPTSQSMHGPCIFRSSEEAIHRIYGGPKARARQNCARALPTDDTGNGIGAAAFVSVVVLTLHSSAQPIRFNHLQSARPTLTHLDQKE